MFNINYKENAVPRYFYNNIVDIKPEDLHNMGAKAVGIDLDNTAFYDASYKPLPGFYNWLESVKQAGIPVIIVSNTYKSRAKRIARMLSLPYIGDANKPDAGPFIKAAEMCKVPIEKFAMIGDQLFTDIQGANKSGAISIRVKYAKREILLALYFLYIRKCENRYLRKKGLGDKI